MKLDPLIGDIILNENPALKAQKAVEDGARNMKQKLDGFFGAAGTDGAQAFMKNLRMGGLVAGAAMAERELANITGKLAELTNPQEMANRNAADFVMELGKSLPVLGGIVSAGENINEIFTHQKAKICEQNQEMERQIVLSNRLAHDHVATLNVMKELDAELARARGQAAAPVEDPRVTAGKKALQDQINAVTGEQQALNAKIWEMNRWNVGAGIDRAVAIARGDPMDDTTNEEIRKAEAELAGVEGQLRILRQQSEKLSTVMEEKADAIRALNLRDMSPIMLHSAAGPAFVADRPQVAEMATAVMERLPSPITQAEELFGPKSVAGSGPAQYADTMREGVQVQKEILSATKDVETAIYRAQPQGPMPNGQQIQVLVGW